MTLLSHYCVTKLLRFTRGYLVKMEKRFFGDFISQAVEYTTTDLDLKLKAYKRFVGNSKLQKCSRCSGYDGLRS